MKTCFTNFTLIDGTGAPPKTGLYMEVENKVITYLGNHHPVERDASVVEVDLGGRTVIPGLMDCHMHLAMGLKRDENTSIAALQSGNEIDFAANVLINLNLLLKEGVTYVRDAGTIADLMPEMTLRKYVEEGWFLGSHMCLSGRIITMTGGHGGATGKLTADGVEECTKAARQMLAAGVDCLKTIGTGGVGTEGTEVDSYQYEEEELAAIAREAHKVGKKVMAHCHGARGIKNALRAGIDSIEHCTLVDDEGIELLVKTGAYIVPTFCIQEWIMEKPVGIPDSMVRKELIIHDKHIENFKKCYEAGVKIACGTDGSPTFMPHGTAKEVAYMVQNSGMSNMEGILCATRNAADLIGVLDKYGTLEIGKVADFVVLGEDPLADITALQRPQQVYLGGKLVHDAAKA